MLISQQRSGFQELTTSSFRIHGHACPTPSDGLSKNRVSAETCLSIRFLETSTCHSILRIISGFPDMHEDHYSPALSIIIEQYFLPRGFVGLFTCVQLKYN
jgi:hypothetical protein